MLIFIIIFLLTTPASSMDFISRFFGKKEAAPKRPLRVIYEAEDQDTSQAMQRSLDPSYDVDPVDFAEWRYSEDVSGGILVKREESPLEQACEKALRAPSELAYLWGLDPQNSLINLAGYMMLLKSRGEVIDRLIRRGRIDRRLKLPILLYMYGW